VAITFSHAIEPVSSSPWISWDSIDDIFARPIFSSLKILHLRAPGVVNFQDLPLPIAPQLPQCLARGILRFDELDEFGYPDFLFM
jgi:hypothetical protein